MKKLGLYASILFLFGLLSQMVGCTSAFHKELLPTPSIDSGRTGLPKWVETPLADDDTFIYGIGEGHTLDSAKQSALKDIAGKLSTYIKSATEIRNYSQSGYSNSSLEEQINTQISKTKLNNLVLKKTTHFRGQTYAMVAMSRDEFVSDKKIQLFEINSKITDQLAGLDKKNKFIKLVCYNEVLKLAAQVRSLIFLIRAADSHFDGSNFLERYQSYTQKEKLLFESIRFFLTSNPELTPLAYCIENALQKVGFQVASPSNTDIVVEIRGTINEKEIFSTKNISIRIQILTKTSSGQLVSGKTYQLNGSSVTSFEAAKENAISTFIKQLQDKKDIYKLIGLI